MSRRSLSVPPFPVGYRASCLLLHVTSLPSPYGIGDVGPAALAWIDRLAEAGQSWWQSLPLGPTGSGNSPYDPLSSFAGNSLHDNPTTREWWEGLPDGQQQNLRCASGSPQQRESQALLASRWAAQTSGSRSSAGGTRRNHGRPQWPRSPGATGNSWTFLKTPASPQVLCDAKSMSRGVNNFSPP